MKNSSEKNYSSTQAQFYDEKPPLYPWPNLLSKSGFKYLFKPREVLFKNSLDILGMKKGDRVLEVGCGQGIFLKRVREEFNVIATGIDVSSGSIDYAKINFSSSGLRFLVGDATKLPFKAKSFDYVISFDTLEHIADQKSAVKEMARVLRKGGKLLIYTLNANDKFTPDWFWEKLGFDIYSRAKHRRELFVNTSRMEDMLSRNDIEVLGFTYFDAFFSLLVDEAVMAKALILRFLGFYRYDELGRVFLKITTFFSRLVYPVVNILDRPWINKGCSLSFVVTGKKK